MNKNNKKKIIVILGCILLIATVIIIILFYNKKDKEFEVSNIETVKILSSSDEAKAAKLIKENVVKIKNTVDNSEIIGTGFFVEEGYLLTNSHIVDIEGKIEIEYFDGTKQEAHLFSNSIDMDLALLKVKDVKAKALTFGNSNELEITDEVLAVGYLYNFLGEASVNKGTLSARRTLDAITYLQSDISMDSGYSGGPLFNDKAEVIAINTFASENGNIALSLCSESVKLIIQILIENPSINYLTTPRSTNSINQILKEIGYIEEETQDIFNQNQIIENQEQKKENSKEEEKEESKNQNNKTNNQKKYICDEGYSLIGNKCVGKIEYSATEKIEKCQSGYEAITNNGIVVCTKIETKPAKEYLYCYNGELKGNQCEITTVDICGFKEKDRYGSCPKGAECFEFSARNIDVLDTISCPDNSPKTSSIVTYNGYSKYVDSNGLTYYKSSSTKTYNCIKKAATETEPAEYYSYDELVSTACKNGNLTQGYKGTTPSGFYCKETIKTHWYVYDVVCSNPEYVYSIIDGHGQCRKKITKYENANKEYICDSDYKLKLDNTCEKIDTYYPSKLYSCNEEDVLNGVICIKNIIKDAKAN